jgi:PST family polysaccharide transporter
MEALLGLRGIALASLLGPEFFGLWSLFRLALHYFGFIGFSLNRGMEVKVAAAGQPRSESVSQGQTSWGQITLGGSLAIGLLSTAVVLTGFWFVEDSAKPVVLAVTLILIPERLWRYALTFTRAAGMFQRFAFLEFVYASLQLIITPVFALVLGLRGAFVGFFAATIASVCIAAPRVPWRPRWSLRRARQVFGLGLPVSLTNISTTVLQTIDQVLVGFFAGIAALGTYAFAISLSGFGMHLALIARNVILTDVYGAESRGDGGEAGRLVMDRSLVVFTTLLPPLSGFAALLLSPVILAFLPQYEAAVVVAQVFVFIGVLQGVVNISVMGIVAEGRQSSVPLISLGAISLNIILCTFTLFVGLGLQGVAARAFLSRMVYAAAINAVLAAARPQPSGYGSVAKSLVPTVWCAGTVLAIQTYAPPLVWESLAVAFLLYSISLIPLAVAFRSTFVRYGLLRSSDRCVQRS